MPGSPICQAEMIPPADPGDGGFMLGSRGKAARGAEGSTKAFPTHAPIFLLGRFISQDAFGKRNKIDSLVR